MFWTYILQSKKNNKYYVGYTSNINQRLYYHNSGKNKSTKSSIPWQLIHQEMFENKKEAWLRERQIKRYKGGEAFKKLISKNKEGWLSG